MFADDRDDGTVRFFVPAEDNMASSYKPEHTLRDGQPGATRDVPTATLTTLLEQAGVARLDFLSMDIELTEPKALAGFNVDRFRPALVCIESHPEVRQQILDYFAAHHYVLVGKYLRLDPHNMYFMPRQGDGQVNKAAPVDGLFDQCLKPTAEALYQRPGTLASTDDRSSIVW